MSPRKITFTIIAGTVCLVAMVAAFFYLRGNDLGFPVKVPPTESFQGQNNKPNTIIINGKEQTFIFGEDCSIGFPSVGGKPTWGLGISLKSSDGKRSPIKSIAVRNDVSVDDILSVGVPRGNYWVAMPVDTGVSGATQTLGFPRDKVVVGWQEITRTEQQFPGVGFVEIRQKLDNACPDKVWVGGRYTVPGEAEYEAQAAKYCRPEFYFFLPPQRFEFRCSGSIYAS